MGCATSKPDAKEDIENTSAKEIQNATEQSRAEPGDVSNPVYGGSTTSIEGAALAMEVSAVTSGAVAGLTERISDEKMEVDGEEGTVDIETLLAEPDDTTKPSARAARRSTDSVFVEQLDIIDYTGIKTYGKGNAGDANPNVRFEVDGIRSTYNVGNSSSMDAMLKASRRAATYHGAGSGPGQAPPTVAQIQMNERRRSNLEKIQMPMLIESKEEGSAVFNSEATHQALAGLDWKQYFTQEGEYCPQPPPAGMPEAGPVSAEGVVSMEQLLDGGRGSSTDQQQEQQPPVKVAGRGRRASAC